MSKLLNGNKLQLDHDTKHHFYILICHNCKVSGVKRSKIIEKLWNEWCNQIYENRIGKTINRQFKSGLDVSLRHGHWFTTWQNSYNNNL